MPDPLEDTDELSLEELQAQMAEQLPERQVMSLITADPASAPVVDLPVPLDDPATEENAGEDEQARRM